MKILQFSLDNKKTMLAQATAVLRSGGLIIYPTETTYGVAVDVQNPNAVQKLLEYKGKRDGKPISVAVSDQDMAERYVRLNDVARQVYATFLPGPVTVVSTGRDGKVAWGITSPEGKIGIRIPNHVLALDLITAFGSGITATGANASDKKRPYKIQDILDHTSQKQQCLIDLIIDAGELPHNEPSTVIDTTLDDIQILRAGKQQLVSDEVNKSNSEEETITIAASLIRKYRSYLTYEPLIIALSGDMGAGKTHFIKGLGKGLGISNVITSPTYILCSEYTFTNEERIGKFLHLDAWRVKDDFALTDFELEKALQQNAVIAIEWSERVKEWIEKQNVKTLWIHIAIGEQENERVISYSLGSDF